MPWRSMRFSAVAMAKGSRYGFSTQDKTAQRAAGIGVGTLPAGRWPMRAAVGGSGMGRAATMMPPGSHMRAFAQSVDIEVSTLSLGYGGKPVVQGISGQFDAGSMTAIVGPNGGGKSTLLKGLLGLLAPMQGSLRCRYPRAALGYLAQACEVERDFPISVEDFVSLGLWAQTGALRAVTDAQRAQISAALAVVGLQGWQPRWIAELSGGQFQRMRFARLWVQNPPVILLDEPFTGVDEPSVDVLLQLLQQWHARGRTVLAVLHDREMVQAYFPQALALAGTLLAWGTTADVLPVLSGARRRA